MNFFKNRCSDCCYLIEKDSKWLCDNGGNVLPIEQIKHCPMNPFVLRALKPEEVLYTFKTQSQDVIMRTGLIGYLRMDFGSSGKEFYTTWWDERRDIKTPEFKQEFDDVINSLRGNGMFLSNLDTMEAFCDDTNNVLHYPADHHYCGVRVDTDNYAYLMRLFPYRGDYNMYCYCYIKEQLDSHIEKAKHGIRIISGANHKELFRLDDGDKLVIKEADGTYICGNALRYIDDYHFYDGVNVLHVDQFAEINHKYHRTLTPLRASLPERCYVFIETSPEIGIIVKGETGYYRTEISMPTRDERKAMVDELNEKLGVTKAQAEAMKAGSMYGWHVPLADPKNYDDEGHLLRKACHHG